VNVRGGSPSPGTSLAAASRATGPSRRPQPAHLRLRRSSSCCRHHSDELAVHQHVVALRDRLQDALAHVLVPERDGQREETFARFRNGEPELGHLIARRHPSFDGIGRDGAREHDDVDRHHVSWIRRTSMHVSSMHVSSIIPTPPLRRGP
jgi:hypothetical protein